MRKISGRRKTLVFLAAAVLFLAIAPFALDGERFDVAALRQENRLSAITLSRGVTEYEHSQREDSRGTVILVHGASGPMNTWDITHRFLLDQGFEVVRYNFYGRGLSDRPSVDYDLDLYVDQLEELIDKLRLPVQVTLVGHSFGCVVASAYATRRPERVAKLALFGPAGFPIEANPLSKLLRAPGVGEYLMKTLGDRLLLSHNKKYFHSESAESRRLVEAYGIQARNRGFKRVQLSTIRHSPLQSFVEGYGKTGELKIKKLLVWGENDQTFPFSNAGLARELLGAPEFLAVKEAGHLPHVEQFAIVHPVLAKFLAD